MLSMKSIVCLGAVAAAVLMAGCGGVRQANIGEIYNTAAHNIGDERNPVIVIPGILGSKLADADGNEVWGAFQYGAVDVDTAEGARIFSLPMAQGVRLSELRDDVFATDVLDTMTVDIGLIRGLEIGAYIDIMKTLAAGRYRDQSLGESGAIDYAGLHYTCYQFAYDWRRDISEQAVLLHEQIMMAKSVVADARGTDEDSVKVDVIAHSMGGLVLRYYLRYGPNALPADGSAPKLTWEGAEHVEQAILIGTPSAGSASTLIQMVEGVQFVALITPRYRPAVLGTMPSIYQLLPRPRHAGVVDAQTGEPIDILDADVWERFGWGLASPGQDGVLEQILPEVASADDRRRIALEHQGKCLEQARRLFEALDTPATPPEGCRISLFAGDAIATISVISVDPEDGSLKVIGLAPGDNTVTRMSALMDERAGGEYQPRLQSPIHWDEVQFLSADHIGLTRDPRFTDKVLYLLLEQPRDPPGAP